MLFETMINKITETTLDMAHKTILKGVDRGMYVLDVDDIVWKFNPVLGQVFKNLPERLVCRQSSGIDGTIEFGYIPNTGNSFGEFKRMTIYHGTPIWFCSIKKNNGASSEMLSSPVFYMKTPATKRNIENLKRFVERLTMKGVEESKKEWGTNSIIHKDGHNFLLQALHRRKFENIFIPKDIEMEIKTSLDSFMSKRKWYIENGIPYHFGILLYGEAGGGKSSLAQAISSYMKATVNYVYGDDVLKFSKLLGREIQTDTMSEDTYRCIIIEDIDCGFKSDDEKSETDDDGEKREKGLAALLNSLDGINAPSNTVYIFTTNHIEKLDKALIRPGRIDLCIEIKPITRETFDQFCIHHYGTTYDGDIAIKPGLTFAKLQLFVMKGYSLEELVHEVNDYENN